MMKKLLAKLKIICLVAALTLSASGAVWSLPPDSCDAGRIAFASNRSGNNEVWVMRPDGTGLVNVTNHPASDRLPAWSPDGDRIAFRSNRGGNTDIYVIKADGSDLVRLTFHPAVDTSPDWTPEGTVIFSSNRGGRFEIYEVNADGTELRRIDIDLPGNLTFPVVSPQDHRIAFTNINLSDTAIWTTHRDGRQLKQFTENALFAAFPDWSPSGNRIAFANNVCPVCDLSEIVIANPGGNGTRVLTEVGDAFNDLFPRWSPDGDRLVFTRDDLSGSVEIYVIGSDGSGATNITNHPALDFEADWGP